MTPCRGEAPAPQPQPDARTELEQAGQPPHRRRHVHLPGDGDPRLAHALGQWVQAQRYARLDLPVGFAVQGPAIFEQADTTVWLEPGYEATVDDLGNLVLQRVA